MTTTTMFELKFRALRIISTEHTENSLSPDQIAMRLHVSRRHLERSFSNGPSVAEVIAAFRIVTSLTLISSKSVVSIDALAKRSGFTDRNTFRGHFVRYCGLAPAAARAVALS